MHFSFLLQKKSFIIENTAQKLHELLKLCFVFDKSVPKLEQHTDLDSHDSE